MAGELVDLPNANAMSGTPDQVAAPQIGFDGNKAKAFFSVDPAVVKTTAGMGAWTGTFAQVDGGKGTPFDEPTPGATPRVPFARNYLSLPAPAGRNPGCGDVFVVRLEQVPYPRQPRKPL